VTLVHEDRAAIGHVAIAYGAVGELRAAPPAGRQRRHHGLGPPVGEVIAAVDREVEILLGVDLIKPVPQGRDLIVDFIAISQISSFRQNGGWRALRSGCRSNCRRCCAPVCADYNRTIRVFVNDLDAIDLSKRRARRAIFSTSLAFSEPKDRTEIYRAQST
jgi:hypothetical protein